MSKQTVTHAHPSGSFWARNRKSGGYLLRKTVRRKGYQLIRFLLLFGLCFMIIQPLLDKLSVSFMAERDLYDSTVISIPRHLTTANYSLAASKILLNYGTTFLNTLIVSLAVSVLQIAACTLVGYGFARFEFPFKKFWFAAVIITVIIPPQTISSSLYLHFNFFDIFGIFKATTGSSLNLRGSPIPYALMSATCMGLKNGLYIYMIRQFFTGIPKSLEEAAYVDGCSIFKTFWRVILPDAVPILVSCFLFSFVWQWTDTPPQPIRKAARARFPGVGIRPCIAPMPVPSSSTPVHSARAKCSSSPSRAALVPTSAGSRPEASSTPVMTLNVTTKPLTVSTARTALRTASGSACESDTAAICDRSSGRKPPLRGAKSMPTITADSTCTP